MEKVTGMLFVNSSNTAKHLRGYHGCIGKDINKALPRDTKYWFSIDQSTKCCGMFLTDINEDIQVVLELKKDSYENKENFLNRLHLLLVDLFRDLPVEKFIMEEVPHSKFYTAYSALKELKGAIRGWFATDIVFRGLVPETIYPQSWKSKIVDKTKSKNRSKVKAYVAEDICDLNPLFKGYLPVSASGGYDGFDAIGIYYGYKLSRYSESGMRKAGGKLETRHTPLAFFKYLPKEFLDNKNYLFYGFLKQMLDMRPQKIEYNPDYTFYENIRLCSSNFKFSYIIIKDPNVINMLHWEFNLDIVPNYYFVMFVLKKSSLTEREIRYCSDNNFCMIAD